MRVFPDEIPSVERGGRGGDFNGTLGLLTLEERPVGRGGRLGLGVLREGSGGGAKLNEDVEPVESDRKWLAIDAEYGWGKTSASKDGVSEREEGVVERESVERGGGGGGLKRSRRISFEDVCTQKILYVPFLSRWWWRWFPAQFSRKVLHIRVRFSYLLLDSQVFCTISFRQA
jgi:hypothetical protein